VAHAPHQGSPMPLIRGRPCPFTTPTQQGFINLGLAAIPLLTLCVTKAEGSHPTRDSNPGPTGSKPGSRLRGLLNSPAVRQLLARYRSPSVRCGSLCFRRTHVWVSSRYGPTHDGSLALFAVSGDGAPRCATVRLGSALRMAKNNEDSFTQDGRGETHRQDEREPRRNYFFSPEIIK
ncbi:hypothetical protein P4O66_010585, partial [Electrophorus voltai]